MEASKNLSDQKLALMKRLMEVDNETTLDEIQAFMDEIEEEGSISNNVPEAHIPFIEQGLRELDNGQSIPWAQVKSKYSHHGV